MSEDHPPKRKGQRAIGVVHQMSDRHVFLHRSDELYNIPTLVRIVFLQISIISVVRYVNDALTLGSVVNRGMVVKSGCEASAAHAPATLFPACHLVTGRPGNQAQPAFERKTRFTVAFMNDNHGPPIDVEISLSTPSRM